MAPDAPVTCPGGACTDEYSCEACLNVHLVDNHGKRYAEVFGAQDPSLVSFCPDHEHLSPSTLGI